VLKVKNTIKLFKNNSPKFQKQSSLSRPKLIALVVAFAAVGGWFVYQSFASTPSADPNAASLYLVPNTQTVAKGATLKVQVRENSGTTQVNAVRADFTYPTDKFEFIGFEQGHSAFEAVADAASADGRVSLSRATVSSYTGDILVATALFKALVPISDGASGMKFTEDTALLDMFGHRNILEEGYASNPPTPSMYLKSDQKSAIQGGQHVINVYMNNGYHDIGTLRAELAYSSSILEFVRAEFPEDNSFLTVRENANDPNTGYYSLELGAVSPQSEYRREYLVAKLYFRNKVAGTAPVIFRTGSQLLNYPSNQNVLVSARGTEVNVTALSKSKLPSTPIKSKSAN